MKFSRGQFVEPHGLAVLRAKIIEAKPGFGKTKYKVRLVVNGQVKTYKEKDLVLSKDQR